MELYTRIKKRRESLGISQSELAQLLKYRDRSTIAKIEAGKNDLTQSKIKAFADVLNTTPAYLMGWTDDPSPSFLQTAHQELSNQEHDLLTLYRQVNSAGQSYIMKQAKFASEQEEYAKVPPIVSTESAV